MLHTIRYYFLSVIILAFITECNRFGPPTSPKAVVFLTGECLKSNILTQRKVTLREKESTLYFTLSPDWDKQDIIVSSWANIEGTIPSNNIFKDFGINAARVKADYNRIYGDIKQLYSRTEMTTVYYENGFILTADKTVGGIPAGQNLYPNVAHIESAVYCSYQLPEETIPTGYSPMAPVIVVALTSTPFETTKEHIAFHAEVPVKVGMYLHYLNDKHSDPEAQMQYRDEVLTCDFVSEAGIR